MFYFHQNKAQEARLEKLFRKIKIIYGTLPPQMEFLGNIEADYLEEFLTTILRIAKHPHINPHLFTFLRLHVAFKEDYPYCKAFNTKLLFTYEYTQEVLDAVVKNISKIPLDEKHQLLATFALKAIYESPSCAPQDFENLYTLGWTQKDVFDAIEHTGTIFRNGRILTAYSSKED